MFKVARCNLQCRPFRLLQPIVRKIVAAPSATAFSAGHRPPLPPNRSTHYFDRFLNFVGSKTELNLVLASPSRGEAMARSAFLDNTGRDFRASQQASRRVEFETG